MKRQKITLQVTVSVPDWMTVRQARKEVRHALNGEILNLALNPGELKAVSVKSGEPVYLVWNGGGNECVGFLDKRDADFTLTGDRRVLEHPGMTPTIGEAFRDAYLDEDGELNHTVALQVTP